MKNKNTEAAWTKACAVLYRSNTQIERSKPPVNMYIY